jgi:tRNA-specific 2-thiouridylase
VRVCFEAPQSAITPGQVVTLYEDDMVLGGGWIERALDPAGTRAPDSQA